MKPISKIIASEEQLRSYCERNDFSGWDPWDALGSPLFRVFPFTQRYPRWAANHILKIAPINARPGLVIQKDCFAKGLALFLSGMILREKLKPSDHNKRLIATLTDRLFDKIIKGYSGPCWGTNVAYQTRAFYVPAETPSLVHTAFAVEAILDLYNLIPDEKYIHITSGACRFALNDLRVTNTHGGIYFSYTPLDHSRVINVTALAARMFARTGIICGDKELIEKAKLAAKYVIATQREDGSWHYGEDSIHDWIDNYHTGFVLDSLEDYREISGDASVLPAIKKGVEFYRIHLFNDDGIPKFSPTSTYPIDGHCLAQGVLTFTRLRNLNENYLPFAQKIALWGIEHFQDADGHFYFQKRRHWLNRISYIRWVQAWMFLALNRLIAALKD